MNGLITTILAGVIVALIGAYAAYYFGGLRERQKQEEETQKEINERRADAVAELRSRASSVGEALKSWANTWARIPEKIPRVDEPMDWARFFRECVALLPQEDLLLNSISSLREFYRRQSPYLEPKQRRLYESFDKDFDRRYTTLSKYLDGVLEYRTTAEGNQALAKIEQAAQEEADYRERLKVYGPLLVPAIPFIRRRRRKRADEVYEEHKKIFSGLREAARPAQEWNLQAHLRAFDAEAERLARLSGR